MNCEAFETLMADALARELSPADKPAFDEHLSTCDACRRLYEAHRGTLDILRSLPEPARLGVERIGERLILHDPRDSSRRRPPYQRLRQWLPSGAVRYAASVLVAFTAGYALHVGLMMQDATRPGAPSVPVHTIAKGEGGGETVEAALVTAHRRNPKRTDLAKCMAALTGSGG